MLSQKVEASFICPGPDELKEIIDDMNDTKILDFTVRCPRNGCDCPISQKNIEQEKIDWDDGEEEIIDLDEDDI